MENPPVVIWCGGTGTRLKEETEFKPKPMVTIGGMPILWHIMKIYSHYGYNDFILCLGYKGEMIKEFFLDYEWLTNDFTLKLKNRKESVKHPTHPLEEWNITFADTGQETLTGERLMKIKKYLGGSDYFLATYGDGVADIDISKLVNFHKKIGKIATLTGVRTKSKYGVVDADENNIAFSFKQKPQLSGMINGGFFVFNKRIFEYIKEGEIIEMAIERLSERKQLAVYKHEGAWHCMDTFKDYEDLNKMWDSNQRPWKVWTA